MSNQDDSLHEEKESSSTQEDLYRQLRDEQRTQQGYLEDVRLLKNRIKHLKREHAIAQQKIGETKQRASQIIKQKNQRREKEKQLEELARKRASMVSKISTTQRMKERERRRTIMRNKLKEKQEGTKGVCEIKNRIKKQLDELREEELKAKRRRRKKLQEDQRKAQKQQQDKLEEQRQKQKAAHIEKLRADKQAIDDRAKEVERLEKLELELIEKLRGTQVVQQGAFESLEKVLSI